jgi:Ni/Fe-hydrogenase 1 B-type cytochrome subunit
VYLDISEGVPVLKSMFTGKIPADFDHGTHEEEIETGTGVGA